MRLRLAPAVLYARARGGEALLVALALVVVLALVAPVEPAQIPLRGLVATHVRPLVATLPGLLLGAGLANPQPAMETVSGRSVPGLRLGWAVLVVAVSSLVVGVALGGPFGLTEVMVRNHLFALGVTAAASTLLAPAASWAPMGLLVAANGIYGTVDVVATPRWWALLEQPAWTAPASAVALVVFAAGMTLWVVRGTRASAGG